MVVRDQLSWILDRPHDEQPKMRIEEQFRQNIEFVHSMGMKCDCVGWSSLDLTVPDAEDILDKIEAFCKERGWLARGGCSRWYDDFESDWYEIIVPNMRGAALHVDDRFERGCRNGVLAVSAHKNKNRNTLLSDDHLVVSERFRDACIKHKIADLNFRWVRDVGRYASEQYFYLFPGQQISHIAGGYGLTYSDGFTVYLTKEGVKHRRSEKFLPHDPGSDIHNRLMMLGGKLARVAEVFYDMRYHLQECYPEKEMPKNGFVYVNTRGAKYYTPAKILIHKDTAECLIQEKVLSKKDLHPVLLYREVPVGYMEMELRPADEPDEQFILEMQTEYEDFIKIPRPARKTPTKEAVTLLRKAKTARKEDFQKRMKKETAATLEGTQYASLMPYYLVADGGSVSDEYQMLPYAKAREATAEFAADMAIEELLDKAVEGVAFACCPDGDKVILRPDGTVVRVSHEIPEAVEDWPTLAQFFADCVELE